MTLSWLLKLCEAAEALTKGQVYGDSSLLNLLLFVIK